MAVLVIAASGDILKTRQAGRSINRSALTPAMLFILSQANVSHWMVIGVEVVNLIHSQFSAYLELKIVDR